MNDTRKGVYLIRPGLVSVATLPCESRNTENVTLQRVLCGLQCFDAVGWAAGRASGL